MIFGFARQSGGHLKIASKLGQGTTVRVYLPRAEGLGSYQADEATDAPLPQGSESILLVDDNAEMRTVARRHLVSLGYRVSEAGSGQAALEVLLAGDIFDLLFTDVVMPDGMTGPQLAATAATSPAWDESAVHHRLLPLGPGKRPGGLRDRCRDPQAVPPAGTRSRGAGHAGGSALIQNGGRQEASGKDDLGEEKSDQPKSEPLGNDSANGERSPAAINRQPEPTAKTGIRTAHRMSGAFPPASQRSILSPSTANSVHLAESGTGSPLGKSQMQHAAEIGISFGCGGGVGGQFVMRKPSSPRRGGRPMPAAKAPSIQLSPDHLDRQLKALVRAHSTPQKLADRARIILLASEGWA